MDSRTQQKPPLRILCQHDEGSCGACCGAYNFKDRSPKAEDERFRRRTERVRAAWPDVVELARARDELLALERPDVLFGGVKVCPFAGYVEETAFGGRVGCLLHPTRHPRGEDLRDLAVYPREVCAGHFCAPHDWLRPREADVAQTARGTFYGRVVTDAGLVKSLCALVDEALGRSFTREDVVGAREAFASAWERLRAWPYADPDPSRFGGFSFSGDDAVERTLPSCLAGTHVTTSNAARTVLDGLGTRGLADDEANAALALLASIVSDVAAAIRSRAGP
jgi:hypothetical protein